VSFSQLRSAVQEERRRKLIEQSEHLLHSLANSVEEDSQSLLCDSEAVGTEAVEATTVVPNLWVDKYAPRHYTHLLSDDVRVLNVSP
jgi:hypothetical protein